LNWVDNDNFLNSYQLTTYFIEQGHRSIAFLGYSPGYRVTRDRLDGYKKALEEQNIPFDSQMLRGSTTYP